MAGVKKASERWLPACAAFAAPESDVFALARELAVEVVDACPKCPRRDRRNPPWDPWRRAVSDEFVRWLRAFGVRVEDQHANRERDHGHVLWEPT